MWHCISQDIAVTAVLQVTMATQSKKKESVGHVSVTGTLWLKTLNHVTPTQASA